MGRHLQIIHLATHGFYYTPTDAENVSRLAGYQNAMLLSGVIMSGGNAGWKGTMLPEGVLDGIMTADDISRLNLKGADLVVLSACGTGLGSINLKEFLAYSVLLRRPVYKLSDEFMGSE